MKGLKIATVLAVVILSFASVGAAQEQFARVAVDSDSFSAPSDNTVGMATPTPTPSADSQDKDQRPKKEKRGTWVIAPIPIVSPAVGGGLIVAGAYVFPFSKDDKKSPPSVLGIAGAFTKNGTRGGAIGGRLYFSENKYQTTFAIAKGRAFVDFYGIGRIPGRAPIVVPLRGSGTIFFGEFMRNIGKDIFIGPRFQYRKLSFGLEIPPFPGGFEIPEIDLRSTSAALGVKVQRDKRDSGFYPTKGSLFEAKADFFDQAFGSRRQYQTYSVAYNAYHSLNEKRLLAYRAMVCFANQSVPFYDLCLFGSNNDLRGYTTGEFQNRRMFATQAELRQSLKGRFGVVAFAGIGGIARRWNEFRSDQLMPAAGAGLRFTLDKKNRINYRVDLAVGRDGHTLTIGVGEAF